MNFKQAAVIIAAAGQGERLADGTNSVPKQFMQLGSVPLFIWSLTTFMQHSKIKEAILVIPERWLAKTQALVLEHLSEYTEQITIIVGGSTRQESVYLALEKLASNNNPPTYVLIHDAARPFIATTYIDKIMDSLEKGFACTLGISLSDSIKKVKNITITEEIDRSTVALMQTPQAAGFRLMLDAHRQAKEKQYVTTDDASIIQAYGVETTVVIGSRLNLKITQPEDLLIARALIDSYGWRPGYCVINSTSYNDAIRIS